MMESASCYFIDGPKAGDRERLEPRPTLRICISPEALLFGECLVHDPRALRKEIEYRLHEFSDETHHALVYVSTMDEDEAFWAYCRHYTEEHLPKIKLLLALAWENGIALRTRGDEVEVGVASPEGWTPWRKHVARFLGRYHLLILGFFELIGLREK